MCVLFFFCKNNLAEKKFLKRKDEKLFGNLNFYFIIFNFYKNSFQILKNFSPPSAFPFLN